MISVLFWVAALCGGSVAFAQQAPPTPALVPSASATPSDLVGQAKALLDTGDGAARAQAVTLLEAALKQDETLVQARVNLGVAKLASGDVGGAERLFRDAVQASPSYGMGWTYLGITLIRANQFADAEAVLRQGMSAAPEEMAIRVALAELLRLQKRAGEAVEVAKEALRVDTRSVDIFNSLGLAYMDQGEWMLARFVYQKALRDADNDGKSDIPGADVNASVHCNLGWTWFQMGDRFTAETELKRAVELDPNLVPALVYLSRLQMDSHNYEDTVPLLERAAKQAPGNHGVLMNLGLAYRGVGKLPEAKAAYQRALEIDPRNPDPHFNLAVLIGDYEKNYAGALGEFKQYVDGGGQERALAEEYSAAIEKEQKQQDKRKKAEDDRKKREEDRKKRDEAEIKAKEEAARAAAEQAAAEKAAAEKAAAEQAAGGTAAPPAPEAPPPIDGGTPAPSEPAPPAPVEPAPPAPAPAGDGTAPVPSDPSSPWGSTPPVPQ